MLKWWRNDPEPKNRRASVWVMLPDGVTPAPLATVFNLAGGDLKIRLADSLAWVNATGTFTNTGIDGHWVYEAPQAETDTDGNQIELNVVKNYVPLSMPYYGRTTIGLEQPTRVAQAVWNVLTGFLGGAGSLAELILRPSGAVVADGGNSLVTFKTNLSSSDSNAYKDQWCCFLDGALAGQVHKVIAYDGATKFLSFNVPYTQIPAGGVRFMLVNK